MVFTREWHTGGVNAARKYELIDGRCGVYSDWIKSIRLLIDLHTM